MAFYGSWNYLLKQNRTIDSVYGLQYQSCCWSARFLVHRFTKNTDPNNISLLNGPQDLATMFQFELKGLGGTQSTQINNLLNKIPGYSDD